VAKDLTLRLVARDRIFVNFPDQGFICKQSNEFNLYLAYFFDLPGDGRYDKEKYLYPPADLLPINSYE